MALSLQTRALNVLTMTQLVLTTTAITDVAGFQAIAPEWDDLLARSEQRSFFLGWHWNWLWWTHFAPADAGLSIICCRDGHGRLTGVAPLYRRRRRVLGLLPVRELLLLGTGIEFKVSEHVGIFAARNTEAAVASAFAAALKDDASWDRLCLHGVPQESSVTSALMRQVGIDAHATAPERAPYIDTSGGWDAYKRTLGRSMRRNVEYYARRLSRQHDCVFEQAASADDVDRGIDDLIRLHQARWQAAGEPGVLGIPVVSSFMRASARAAYAAHQLRLWRLRIDGRVEAVLIGFADNGVLHYFQKGFNPAYAADDLGTAMLGLCVKACCEDEELRAFDFMGGAADYKWMWAREHRTLVRYEAGRRNVRTLAQGAWTLSVDATTRFYRAAAPSMLREARRRWHKRRRLHEAPTTTAPVTAATSSSAVSRASPTGPPS